MGGDVPRAVFWGVLVGTLSALDATSNIDRVLQFGLWGSLAFVIAAHFEPRPLSRWSLLVDAPGDQGMSHRFLTRAEWRTVLRLVHRGEAPKHPRFVPAVLQVAASRQRRSFVDPIESWLFTGWIVVFAAATTYCVQTGDTSGAVRAARDLLLAAGGLALSRYWLRVVRPRAATSFTKTLPLAAIPNSGQPGRDAG